MNVGLRISSHPILEVPQRREIRFQFDREEFERHAHYRAVELDNGGMMIAENAHFAEVFQTQVLDVAERRMRYITEGCVVDEKLRKRK